MSQLQNKFDMRLGKLVCAPFDGAVWLCLACLTRLSAPVSSYECKTLNALSSLVVKAGPKC